MPRVHTVKKARKDYPEQGIKKGDTYYYWTFRYGGKRKSKTYPKPSQLTQSSFLQTYYGIQENIQEWEGEISDLESFREEVITDLESLRDESQDSLDQMPDHLQDSSPVGEMLTARVEGIEEWLNELENIEVPEEEEIKEEAMEAISTPYMQDKKEEDLSEDNKEKLEEKMEELKDDKIQELKDQMLEGDPGVE